MVPELESVGVADDCVAEAVDGLATALDALVRSVRLGEFTEPEVEVAKVDGR